MKKKQTHTKKQLMINLFLTIFTFFTLGCCILAWFSASKNAYINSLQMRVDRMELNQPTTTTIQLRCPTKIGDTDAATFNQFAAVHNYKIFGEGKLVTTVQCHGPGMLGYVCDLSNEKNFSGDYYSLIVRDIKAQTGKDVKNCTFTEIKNALKTINKRTTGKIVNGNTEITIVYWVEYDSLSPSDYLSDSYWYTDTKYYVDITFVA